MMTRDRIIRINDVDRMIMMVMIMRDNGDSKYDYDVMITSLCRELDVNSCKIQEQNILILLQCFYKPNSTIGGTLLGIMLEPYMYALPTLAEYNIVDSSASWHSALSRNLNQQTKLRLFRVLLLFEVLGMVPEKETDRFG